MSETGATVITTPSRDDLVMGAFEECSGPYIGSPLEEIVKLTAYTESVVDYLLFVLGRRGRIVPADAVVIDRATADTAAEACELSAGQFARYAATTQDDEQRAKRYETAARYRAAAAVLRGGGNG